MRFAAFPLTMLSAVLLTACGDGSGATDPAAQETEVPEELQEAASAAPVDDAAPIGTPMEDRVATIGVLNKRNNLAQEFEMKPGDTRRYGDVVLRMSACERTAPWEMPQETGAFVQVIVRDTGTDGEWNQVFSGWLFKNSPSLNVVEHPIYDVWVKDCAMSFPGEGSADDAPDSDGGPDENPDESEDSEA